jgi:hypothetical protein
MKFREELGTGEQERGHGIVEEIGAGRGLEVPGLHQEILRLARPVLDGGPARGGVPRLAQARAGLGQLRELDVREVLLIGQLLAERGLQVEGVDVEAAFDRRVIEGLRLLPLEPAEGQAGAQQVGQRGLGGRRQAGQGVAGGREVRFQEKVLRAPERPHLA